MSAKQGGARGSRAWTGLVGVLLLILIVAGLGLSTMKFAQINEGERGIIVTQGRVEGIQEPGIFFRPFAPFTTIEVVNVRRQTRTISQNVASSDKQLYDIDIQVDYSRLTSPDALRASYGEIGVLDEQLIVPLDGYINDALKSASTQFTLDQALSDRGGFAARIRQFLTTGEAGRRSPSEQLYIQIYDVKVLDIKVGEEYARLLAEKANLEVQIETEQKRREQIEAQQANNLFQAEQEAQVALTRERGKTAAALEAANREAQVRAIEGRYWRENPELFELRKRELMVQMLDNGNIWFIDPNTDLTLLLNQMGETSTVVTPPARPDAQPSPSAP
ncbi:MAG: SPFH domain-containing protein [Oscillochloridaceae bacterium]|nr:SPFH domain-containing protein [Chloroflexaceae bacterium]MDW8391592.1 SPFH domain-containing protein [Oscillochloridaceae bacterium]